MRGNPEVRGVYAGSIDEAVESRRLVDSDTAAVYSSSGHLLFGREGKLFAQQFEPTRLTLSGDAFLVADHLDNTGQNPGISVSREGSIAFRTSSSPPQRQFVWFDRSGREISPLGESVRTGLSQPSLSSDGQHVVFYRNVDGNVDIWMMETKRALFSRVTTDPSDDVGPVWSPDRSRIAFSSNRTGIHNIYSKSAHVGGPEDLLLATPEPKFLTDWSRDGRYLLYNSQDPTKGVDVRAVLLDGKRQPLPVAQTGFREQGGQFSPDGNWVAYESNESGRAEIYVQPFPGPGTKSLVSTTGGTQVRWGADGKELFYVGSDSRLMVVSVRIPSGGHPSTSASR